MPVPRSSLNNEVAAVFTWGAGSTGNSVLIATGGKAAAHIQLFAPGYNTLNITSAAVQVQLSGDGVHTPGVGIFGWDISGSAPIATMVTTKGGYTFPCFGADAIAIIGSADPTFATTVVVSFGDGNSAMPNGGVIPVNLQVQGNQLTSFLASTDGLSGTTRILAVGGPTYEVGLTGTGLERRRQNFSSALIPQATYTAAKSTTTQTNYNALGIMLTFKVVTLISVNLQLTVSVVDPTAGTAVIFTATAVTSAVTSVYVLHPAVTTVSGQNLSTILPQSYIVTVTPSATGNNDVYAVGGMLTAA